MRLGFSQSKGKDHLASVVDSEGSPTPYTTSDRDLLTRESSPASGSPSAVTSHRYPMRIHGQRWSRFT